MSTTGSGRHAASKYMTSDGLIDTARLKADASIAEVASAVTTLRRCGGEARGLCPFHDEGSPSFFVNEGKGLFHCFGCDAGGDTIELHRLIHGGSFIEACLALGAELPVEQRPEPAREKVGRAEAVARARNEWRNARPIDGTVAERYLLGRGIGHAVPGSIRFGHPPRYWREDGSEGTRHPAMIAAAQDRNGRVVGIQRTYLDRDGRKSTRGEARLSLGRMRGSALRLGPVSGRIMLASAVEDALSLRLMFPGASVWSAYGDANLAHVDLPPAVRHVTLCGDDDGPGRAAVAAARQSLERRGVEVDELFPRGGAKDFNEEWLLLHA